MITNLKGQVTVITGASAGMGIALARKFAEAGSSVVLAARRKEHLKKVEKEITKAGGKALVVPTDVTKYDQVKALMEAATKEFGQVDILVNNAGYGLYKSFLDSSIHEIDGQIDANLKGVCYGCHAVLPQMIKRKKGQIINIGSIASLRHFPNFATYTAAKFGVLGLTRSLYEEVRPHGIRMNVICPAAVSTEFCDVAGLTLPWPVKDLIQPEDIAELALTCVGMPSNIHLDTMVVWPTCQPTA